LSRGKPPVNVLVLDRYTKQSKGAYSLRDPLTLSLSGKRSNLLNDLELIEQELKSEVHPTILDLYNIALVVYVWDLQTYRTGVGPRYSSILMSVSDKPKWDNAKSHLEATLRFLTGDTFNFHFVQGKAPRAEFEFQEKSENCVALLSGGLDSLAGVKWMMDGALKPVLVSHPGMGLISDAQTRLVTSLRTIAGEQLPWHQIRATAKPGRELASKEYTQFSRSFLYLTLGAIFALHLGVEQEFAFENGVLGLNIPLTQSRIYSNTRTAHPQFLAMYQGLLNLLFDRSVIVENPFMVMTKGEVVKLLNSDGFRDLIKTTISCPNVTRLRWKGVQVGRTRHCGVCFPCVVRRAAVHYSDLWNYDASYETDITSEYADIPEEGRRMVFEMTDFGRQIKRLASVDEALYEFPQLYTGEIVDPRELFDMVKRHVVQFEDFLVQRCHGSLSRSLRLT